MADSPWDMLSAIGTLAAVGVALWFSGRAGYLSRRADKDRAELVAAKILSTVSSLERKSSYLWGWFLLDDVEPTDGYANILLAVKELEVMGGVISVDDLYPLLHLKNHAAKRSARALGLINIFCAEAQAVMIHPTWSDSRIRKIHYERWTAILSEIRDHLAVAVAACESAASTGAPRPTLEEIHG